jgi:hypothetical protein
MPRIKVKSGLRGTKYFIEFPFSGENIDSYSLLEAVEKKINSNKKKFGTKITNRDNYMSDGKIAYLVDYQVTSSMLLGTKSLGSVYIRGIKGDDGFDSFKFILEKSNDFSDFDA